MAAIGVAALVPRAGQALAAARTGDLLGEPTYYLTQGAETLLDVALERNLGVPEISAVNPGVDPWVPGSELLLTLPTQFILPDAPREGIVVNYGELRVFYFRKGQPVQTFAIGIGRDGFELKMGRTTIVRKKEKPTWYPTKSTRRDKPEVGTVVPPGPDNPLGEYAMYLGWPTYLMHGTNKPYGVGRRVSRGCIRMYPAGVEQLYGQVAVGTKVTAVDQRVKLGWHEGELYLEAQPDWDQLDELEATQTITPKPILPEDRQLVADRAGPDARAGRLEPGGRRAARPTRHAGPGHAARAGGVRRRRGHVAWRQRRHPRREAGASSLGGGLVGRDLLIAASVIPEISPGGQSRMMRPDRLVICRSIFTRSRGCAVSVLAHSLSTMRLTAELDEALRRIRRDQRVRASGRKVARGRAPGPSVEENTRKARPACPTGRMRTLSYNRWSSRRYRISGRCRSAPA